MQLNATQMQALSEASQRDFEARLMAHCRAYFPDQCHALGEDGTRGMVRDAVGRARRYGFKIERHVSQFVDILFTFGEGFDTDAKLRWPATILTDPAIADPAERISRLCDAASEHLDGC